MKLHYKIPLIFVILLAAYLSITAALAVIFYPKPGIEFRPCFAEKMEIADIPRAAKVNDGLYRGGLPGDEGLAVLKKLGVNTILDLHADYKDGTYTEKARAMGFEYIAMPLREEPPSEQIVRDFISIIENPDLRPVFIHCERGKIRTSVLLAVYRIQCEGWSNELAFEEMQYFDFNTYHRETFFFGSCAVHTDLAEYVRNYKPPGRRPGGADAKKN